MNRPANEQRSRVVIHADDLGETVEITRGILQGMDAGRVTSTSLMANMPGTDLAIEEASRRGKNGSFGVHLVLCEGPTLTRPRTLSDARGEFLPKRTVGLRGLTRRLDLEAVEAELRAQIRRIVDGGVQVSHFDSHKHLHQLPGVRGVVVKLAREFGVSRVRCTLEDGLWPEGVSLGAWPSRMIRVRMARQARELFAASGLRHPVRFFDVRQVMEQDRDRRIALLTRPGALSEMVCHPGTPEADREKPGSCNRHDELQFLISTEFADLMNDAGVDLVTYWDC